MNLRAAIGVSLCATLIAWAWLSHNPTRGHVVNGVDQRVSPNGLKRPSVPQFVSLETVRYENKGTVSEYQLEIDWDEFGYPERINFPSGGWLEAEECAVFRHGNDWELLKGSATYTIDR